MAGSSPSDSDRRFSAPAGEGLIAGSEAARLPGRGQRMTPVIIAKKPGFVNRGGSAPRVLSRSTERKGTRFVLSQLEEELSRQQLVNTMK
jgi:hypothetical protein